DFGARKVLHDRSLGDDVDVAAAAAAAVVRRGALEDLDAVDVEGVARIDARAARAIDVDVAARIEATDLEIRSRRAEAVLARFKADAGRVPQHLRQRGRLALGDDRAGNDRHRLRRIE